jgi:hypothetical protein
MKSINKGILFGFLCSVFEFWGCVNSGSGDGSSIRNSAFTGKTGESAVRKSNPCCNSSNDSLLIYDEFRSKFESKKFLCVISYSNECPMAKAYIKTIQKLFHQFGDTVQFCILDPGVGSRPISGMEDLLFRDNLGVICGRFGITVYPQAAVINCLTRAKIYTGKIDDRAMSLGVMSQVATKNYLFDVLNNLILEKPNNVASNQPVGCFVGPFDSQIK